MLQKIDGYLGTILNKLTRLGLMKNATVMVVSDHGFLNTTGIEVSPGTLPQPLSLSSYPPFLTSSSTMRRRTITHIGGDRTHYDSALAGMDR